jgi:hypothetical protein
MGSILVAFLYARKNFGHIILSLACVRLSVHPGEHSIHNLIKERKYHKPIGLCGHFTGLWGKCHLKIKVKAH